VLVHRTDHERSATVKVAWVEVEGHADCSVWLTEVEAWAQGPLKWCWVDAEHRAELVVFVVDNPQWADVLLFATPNENWVRGEPSWG